MIIDNRPQFIGYCHQTNKTAMSVSQTENDLPTETESNTIREIRSKFVGKWQLKDSENFEAFMSEMGAPYLLRKVAKFAKPDCEIGIVDGKLRICMKTSFMTQDELMEFDKDEEKEFMRDKKIVYTTYENGKIIQKARSVNGSKKPVKNTRYIEGEDLIMVMEVGDVVAKRIFGRTG